MQEKRLDWKDKTNIKAHDITTWLTNNYNTRIDHISHISQSKDNLTMKLSQLIKYNKRNIFLQKLYKKMRQAD